MISKTEISGLIGRMSFQTGWSAKISKRKWIILQIFLPVILVTPIFLMIAYFTSNDDWIKTTSVFYFMIIFAGIFGHKEWNRDQQKMIDKENEEEMTL